MTFQTDMVNGLGTIYAMAGEAATFTPIAGDPVPLNVIVDYAVNWEPSGQVQVADDHIELHYRRADIDRRVVKGETFTVGSKTYTVRSMAQYPDAFDDLEGRAIVLES